MCPAKETLNKIKSQPTEWDKVFANHIPDEELIPEIYKEALQLDSAHTHTHTHKKKKKHLKNI